MTLGNERPESVIACFLSAVSKCFSQKLHAFQFTNACFTASNPLLAIAAAGSRDATEASNYGRSLGNIIILIISSFGNDR